MEAAGNRFAILPYSRNHAQLSDEQRAARFYLVLAWAYPFLPILSLYTMWLTGWMMLGHPPQAMVDDPKNIGGPVDAVYVVAGFFLVTFPLGMLVGVTVGIFVTCWYVHSRTRS